MMLELNYAMHISFDQPVRDHHFVLRLLPHPDANLVVHQQTLIISGDHDHGRLHDGFNNRLITGIAASPHHLFSAQLQARVARSITQKQTSSLPPSVYLPQQHLTRFDAGNADVWLEKLPQAKPTLDFVNAICERVYQKMVYATGSTEVNHTVAELIHTPMGVCQDYAHLMIGLLRHHHIPARYIAGVANGEGHSHAWVEAWIDHQWIAFDPTHNLAIKAQDPYIAFAIGRDFSDCPLNSGCYTGKAQQTLQVQAQLTPLS